MSLPINPFDINRVEQKAPDYPNAPEIKLFTWLETIYRHAIAGSRESLAALVKLSERAPTYSFASLEIQEGVEKIMRIAATNQWNPELPTLTSSIYDAVLHQYFPEIKKLTS
jgi:hypothetical protein